MVAVQNMQLHCDSCNSTHCEVILLHMMPTGRTASENAESRFQVQLRFK